MFKKETALNVSAIVLGAAAIMDFLRGIAHTFRVRFAAANGAEIEPLPDSLFLLGAFGISNFLTSFLFVLILWKARHLVPYVLAIIPVSYFLGAVGMRLQDVQPEAAFNGRYIMMVYLSVCTLTVTYYLLSSALAAKREVIPGGGNR